VGWSPRRWTSSGSLRLPHIRSQGMFPLSGLNVTAAEAVVGLDDARLLRLDVVEAVAVVEQCLGLVFPLTLSLQRLTL